MFRLPRVIPEAAPLCPDVLRFSRVEGAAPMAVSAVNIHRWTREEYERLAEDGFFGSEGRVELIEGIVYDMSPQKSLRAAGVRLIERALSRIFGTGWDVRGQMPLALGDDSEPEPDVAVVAGSPRDYRNEHPKTAALVVEVADASLAHDRKRKVPLYARAGIPEVWLLVLAREEIEVYSDPSLTGYRSRRVLGRGDTVSPLARPDAVLAVDDLLP